MQKLVSIIIGLFLISAGFSAPAASVMSKNNGMSYDYVDLGVNMNDHSYSDSRTRIDADLSIGIMDHLAILGGFKYSPDKNHTKMYGGNVGAIYHVSIIDNLDVFGSATVQYRHSSTEVSTRTCVENCGGLGGVNWGAYDCAQRYLNGELTMSQYLSCLSGSTGTSTGGANNAKYETKTHTYSDSDTGYEIRAGARYRVGSFDLRGYVYHSDVAFTETGIVASGLYDFGGFGLGLRVQLGNYYSHREFGIFGRYNF